MTDVVVVYRGWNNSASSWGSGVWSGDSAVEGASGNTGSVSITASANISVTGVVGTGRLELLQFLLMRTYPPVEFLALGRLEPLQFLALQLLYRLESKVPA
jgi:hypothetical protein